MTTTIIRASGDSAPLPGEHDRIDDRPATTRHRGVHLHPKTHPRSWRKPEGSCREFPARASDGSGWSLAQAHAPEPFHRRRSHAVGSIGSLLLPFMDHPQNLWHRPKSLQPANPRHQRPPVPSIRFRPSPRYRPPPPPPQPPPSQRRRPNPRPLLPTTSRPTGAAGLSAGAAAGIGVRSC